MVKNTKLFDTALTQSLGLKDLSHIDARSDDEVELTLSKPGPVTSEKNVWAYWATGWSTMKPWNKRNVIAWVRLLGPSWTVRVLDRVPGSAAHVSNFIEPDLLPETFKNDLMTGKTAHVQGSDMVRLPLIYLWGGVYMDVSIMLFMHLDDMCWRLLQDAGSRFQVALPSVDPLSTSGIAGSFFVASRKGNGFIRRWNDIFKAVWDFRADYTNIHADPLFRHMINHDGDDNPLLRTPKEELDYFSHILSFERLRSLKDPSDGFDGAAYCKNKVLLLAYRECASAALLTNDDGEKQFRLLRTQVTPQVFNNEWVRAQEFAHHLLSTTAMMKLPHFNGRDTPSLATLWDMTENHNADIEPGSFGELLRQTTMFFTQDRTIESIRFPDDKKTIFSLGVLEEYEDDMED